MPRSLTAKGIPSGLRIRIQQSRFDLEDWQGEKKRGGFTYRPTGAVLIRRVAVLIVCMLLVGGSLAPIKPIWDSVTSNKTRAVISSPEGKAQAREMQQLYRETEESVKRMLTPEQWQRVQARMRQAQAEREAAARQQQGAVQWFGVGLLAIYSLIPLLFGLVGFRYGLLDTLRYPVERLEIARIGDQGLVIRHRRLFKTSETRIPLSHLASLSWYVRRERTRYYRAWIWTAMVLPDPASGQHQLAFAIERQKHEPDDPTTAPPRLRRFLDNLAGLTGLEISAPNIIRDASGRRVRGWKHSFTTHSTAEDRTEYKSLDEMPADVRQLFEQMLSDPAAKEKGFAESFRMTVHDSDGQTRTYTSVEDLPPELRKQIERQRKNR